MYAPFCCPNTLQWRWRLCVDLRLLYLWNGVALAVHKQAVRLYFFVCAWTWMKGLLAFDAVLWGHNSASYAISLSTYTIYNNGDDDSLLIFVRWTYGTGVVLSLDGQAVRLHCCVCARMRRCYWCSMQYVVVISPSSYGNDGSALIFVCWTYGTTGVVLALNQQLVRLYCCVCVLEFEGLTY